MINSVTLVGRLGNDPELRYTSNDKALCTFRLAVSRPQKGETDWITVVAWEKTAEFVGKYLTKGSLVAVEGRLQVRKWEDSDGAVRYSTEVVARNVGGLEKKVITETKAVEETLEEAEFEDPFGDE